MKKLSELKRDVKKYKKNMKKIKNLKNKLKIVFGLNLLK